MTPPPRQFGFPTSIVEGNADLLHDAVAACTPTDIIISQQTGAPRAGRHGQSLSGTTPHPYASIKHRTARTSTLGTHSIHPAPW
ncbi:hypothetical protein VTO73DRAFT_3878 [Trametes versicolor]